MNEKFSIKLITSDYIHYYDSLSELFSEFTIYGDTLAELFNEIIIIDYKLKNTDDQAYLKQLAGYKKYISSCTLKEVNTYLYSIIDSKFTLIK